MKVYVSVDMEGISGIVLREQVFREDRLYQESRHLLVGDVNAVVQGALDGGADDVLVLDAHGSGFNFVPEDLHEGAEYILGGTRQERLPFLEGSDALFLVGYHAMAGTENAIRDHTMSSLNWQDFALNGRTMGEIGIDALVAGCLGVPVALVTGDDKACAEGERFLPGVLTAVVKWGLGRHSGRIIAPKRARALLRERAASAVRQAKTLKPVRVVPPIVVRLRYTGTDLIDNKLFDGVSTVKVDARTVEYRGDDLLEVLSRCAIQPYSRPTTAS